MHVWFQSERHSKHRIGIQNDFAKLEKCLKINNLKLNKVQSTAPEKENQMHKCIMGNNWYYKIRVGEGYIGQQKIEKRAPCEQIQVCTDWQDGADVGSTCSTESTVTIICLIYPAACGS